VRHLAASDYRGILEFLQLAEATDGPDPFPEELLLQLRRLVPCDVVSYGDFQPDRRGWRNTPRWVGDPRAPVTDAIRDAFDALRHQYPHTPFDATPVLRWSDRLSRRARRRLELYWEVDRPLGCEYELTVWLRDGDAIYGSFSFDRFSSDFGDRDVQILETLGPHLLLLARRAARRWPDAAALLTAREREIVAWIARGKKNREIAERLYISPGTVRKHLENVYAKLDVPNRTAAVMRAYGSS
jgi:DNA-binding CsgD family transcriptional regulator